MCTALRACEAGEGGVACVPRCKAKDRFFSVGRHQPHLRATDLEHANGAKQKVIASGIPRRERFNPCVAVRDGSPEGVVEWGLGLRGDWGKDGSRGGSVQGGEKALSRGSAAVLLEPSPASAPSNSLKMVISGG